MTFPVEEYRQRLHHFQVAMAEAGIAGAILMHALDIYYLTGSALRSTLVVAARGKAIHLAQINHARTREESAVEDVRDATRGVAVAEVLAELELMSGQIGMEKDVVPAARVEKLAERLPGRRIVDISPIVLQLRMFKSPNEIDLIRQAGRVSKAGFDRIRELLRPGQREIELECAVEEAKIKAGHQGGGLSERAWTRSASPATLVISGPVNTIHVSGNWVSMTGVGPSRGRPWGGSHRQLETGDLVYMDNGTIVEGYHSDEGRTLVVGLPSKEQERVFASVLAIHRAAIGAVRSGVTVASIYRAAWEAAAKQGFEKEFMGLGKFGVEYVGHGVGLEIDEWPLVTPHNKLLLRPGIVMAIEPKLMIPGWGGLGMEDTVLVTEDGYEMLTCTPQELLTPS